MKRITLCWSAYLSPWWMKVIAALVVGAGVLGLVLAEQTRNWEPAWPRPTLAHAQDVEEFGRGDTSKSQIRPVPLASVRGLLFDWKFDYDFVPSDAPQLRYAKLHLPQPDPDEAPHATSPAARKLIAALAELPSLDTVELSGFLHPEVLEPLRGATQIQRLITSNLTIIGRKGDDPTTDPDYQMGLIIDVVDSLPNATTWGVPKGDWFRINADMISTLDDHPSLTTLYVTPQVPGPKHVCMNRSIAERFPDLKRATVFVNASRFGMSWFVLCGLIIGCNLIAAMAAEMLIVSSAPMLPSYAEWQRRAMLLLFLMMGLVAVPILLKAGVAFLPAVVLVVLGWAISIVMFEVDARRPITGTMIFPAAFTPLFGVYLPLGLRGRAQYWLWWDEFLRTSGLTSATVALIVAAIVLFVIGWRAIPQYTAALAHSGRTSALAASRSDALKQVGRWATSRSAGGMSGRRAIKPSAALETSTLSSPATHRGLAKLLDEGMMRLPVARALIGMVTFAVLFPVFFVLATPDGLSIDPGVMARIAGGMVLILFWARPFLFWNERGPRLPVEIGMLGPRQDFARAIRLQVVRQLVPAAALTAVVASVVNVTSGGIWFGPVLICFAAVPAVAVGVSIIELFVTIRSPIAKMLAVFGIGYTAAGMAVAVFAMVSNRRLQEGGSEYWALLPLGLFAAFAFVLWRTTGRRIRRFEFGRLA